MTFKNILAQILREILGKKRTEDHDGEDPDENEYYLYNGQGQRIVKDFDDGTESTMTRYLYTGTEIIMTAGVPPKNCTNSKVSIK